jgi:hypothetical protein
MHEDPNDQEAVKPRCMNFRFWILGFTPSDSAKISARLLDVSNRGDSGGSHVTPPIMIECHQEPHFSLRNHRRRSAFKEEILVQQIQVLNIYYYLAYLKTTRAANLPHF